MGFLFWSGTLISSSFSFVFFCKFWVKCFCQSNIILSWIFFNWGSGMVHCKDKNDQLYLARNYKKKITYLQRSLILLTFLSLCAWFGLLIACTPAISLCLKLSTRSTKSSLGRCRKEIKIDVSQFGVFYYSCIRKVIQISTFVFSVPGSSWAEERTS